MRPAFILILMVFNVIVTAQLSHEGVALVVKTNNGLVKGTYDSGISVFKGVPFAQSPIGDLRWKAPQPPGNWEGVKKADKFGPRAMQHRIFDDMNFRSDGMSEDCLYLNIWTPSKTGQEGLAVLVYFYGGGLFTGDGSEYRYDGESMARKGIIAVTVNYRLNVFGFLAHPDLTAESPHHASGNYGFLDQAAALEWIHQNISAFGGDPSRITIAGESAGSTSVSALMASPISKGLIAGAIGSSASILGTLPTAPLKDAEKIGLEFAAKLGAGSITSLRSKSAEEILEATSEFGRTAFRPTIDGYLFPKSVYKIYDAGDQAPIPLMLGWNSMESGYRSILRDDEPTVDNYKKALNRLYPETSEALFRLYSASNKDEVIKAATDLASDRFTGYSTWKWGDVHSQTGGKPVFRYFYTHPRPALGDNAPTGAVHSAEIEYAMGNLPTNFVYDWTPDDYKVSALFQEYYANFVKTGDPNGLGLPPWPALNEGDPPQVLYIGIQSHAGDEKNRDRYLFLNQFYSN